MSIVLKIDGAETRITEFALPEMSLSSARSRMDKREFEIQIDSDELLRLLDDDYRKWVIDSKEDDVQCGSPQDELGEADYPELKKVLLEQDLLDLVVGGYLFKDLIEKFSTPSSKTIYWWDDVSSCTYNSKWVLIQGVCYSKRD